MALTTRGRAARGTVLVVSTRGTVLPVYFLGVNQGDGSPGLFFEIICTFKELR